MNIKVGTILRISGKLCKVTNVEVDFDEFEISNVRVQVQGEINSEFDLDALQQIYSEDGVENLGVLHRHACDPLDEIEVG